MIKEMLLNTKGMFDEMREADPYEYELWNTIAEMMHGEKAIVVVFNNNKPGNLEYVFIGLTDNKKNKELFYLIEQDPMTGCYGDNREVFDRIWDAGEYVRDSALYLEENQVETIKV